MDRLELDAFLILAEELHFGRTAERLHLSTARISQVIKKLERRIGAPLFERSGRGVALTSIGGRLEAELRPAHERIRAAVDRAIEAGRGLTGTLTFSTVESSFHLFGTAIHDFQNRNPGSFMKFRNSGVTDPFALLRQGEADVLASWLPVREPDLVASAPAFQESLTVAVPVRHPLAARPSVELSDLTRDAVIRIAGTTAPHYWTSAVSPDRTPDGRPIPHGPSAETLLEALAFASVGQGLALVAEHVARRVPRPDLVYVPVADAPTLEWGLVWLRSGETARVRAFVGAVQPSFPN
ncbi:LysR family transcriptional regulator [Kitasatospora sp. HPMI-4]|uniref:LysR family transcriptional regulator n=1 Tax=Kitasatospora sp. HPMI-4 TaxID=3448443 RepID=UPI003F194E1B